MVRNSKFQVFLFLVMVSVAGLGFRAAFAAEKGEPEKGTPAELKGFQGMMSGELLKKGEMSLVFRVGKIMKQWQGNKAEHPEKAVGKALTLNLNKVSDHHREQIRENFRNLKEGDPIELEAFDLGEETLSIKEWLKKAEPAKKQND